MGDITDTDWAALMAAPFDTAALLHAVDGIDEVRGHLADGDDGAPPQLRTDLLRLHQVAMAVFHHGSRRQADALFDLAIDLEDQVDSLIETLERIRGSLEGLTALAPDNLSE